MNEKILNKENPSLPFLFRTNWSWGKKQKTIQLTMNNLHFSIHSQQTKAKLSIRTFDFFVLVFYQLNYYEWKSEITAQEKLEFLLSVCYSKLEDEQKNKFLEICNLYFK
ncbi:hypothetical protein [Mycoplasma sp. 3341]|uniref:hypothetical protein n=1 Tax=Mycoplasma sp. 3341 TaxID=3447506 RepID=UPI003F65901B